MFVEFDQLDETARIWIYQSDRKLTEEEQQLIQNTGEAFITQWTAHGKGLKGSIRLFYDRFLVLAVDENFNQASGCSIDASVYFIKELENQFSINFFDRTKIAFLHDGEIFIEDMLQLKEKIQNGHINGHHKTFNNHITTKAEMNHSWITSVEESWLKRYF